MMLDDENFISKFVDDEENPEKSQEEQNEENLFKHDAEMFYENIDKRISHMAIRYYLENISKSDLNYWERLFLKFVSSYYLSPLVNEYFVDKDLDFVDNVRRLILDVKSKLIELFEIGEITYSISREEILIRYGHNFGKYFSFFLKFVSDEFYNRFLNKVFEESKMDSVL